MTYTVENRGFGLTAVVTGEANKAEFAAILESGIVSIELNYTLGWEGRNLDPLIGLRGIHALSLLPGENTSIEPVNSLLDLERLYIGGAARGKLNIKALPMLHELRINLHKGLSIAGIENAVGLKCLCANLPAEYWHNLRSMQNLVDLDLSLGKCSRLPSKTLPVNLRALSLARFGSLSDISELEELGNLRFIDFDTCRKIYDFSIIGHLRELECLILCDCGLIKNFEFAANLLNLRALTLNGDSFVEDGKLDFIHKLPKLEYLNIAARRHYNIGYADVNEGQHINLGDMIRKIKNG